MLKNPDAFPKIGKCRIRGVKRIAHLDRRFSNLRRMQKDVYRCFIHAVVKISAPKNVAKIDGRPRVQSPRCDSILLYKIG